MNSTQVNCFISLGKTLNFTQTAKDLYLSQPTVSKNIHNLEKEIGIKLIFHDHRKICLTDEGKLFYQTLINVDNEITTAIKEMYQNKTQRQRTISIGYSGLPFEKQFLPIFIQLMNEKGKWKIELRAINISESDTIKLLDNQEIDYMIYQSDFFKDPNYSFSPMLRAGFSVIIRRDSPLQKYKRIPLKALCSTKIYLWDGGVPLQSVALLKKAIEDNNSSTTPSIEIIHKVSLAAMLVQAKSGIAIVPSFVYDNRNTDVYYRFLDWDHYTSYGLGYLKEKQEDLDHSEVTINMQKAIKLIKKRWTN